ncbi:alcohol dehydrogenase catalytic domain-containing protein [Sphingomonas sp. NBWT7]|uniref:alcohol dehydrogenase catalytic domain-containing protein n=1 Tax=Sphingomonas sp. NBWT7 TaxID=2596913 RepID=UPI001CA4777C|nr:alcohol dehydrogenase catalytic domain-containing protein [Sphingomonas sp. NBWT7]
MRAYSAADATSPRKEVTIRRHPPAPMDVVLYVPYCGVCHKDVHQVRDEWNDMQPTKYRSARGHKMVDRVAAVGNHRSSTHATVFRV